MYGTTMMTTAVWLLLYGATLAWLAPPILGRMTASGISPRMGAAAWIAAVAAALVTWLVALALAIGATADSVHTGAVVTLCLELFGFSDHTRMAGPIGLLTLIVAATLTLGLVALRVCRCISRLRARSHEHAQAARIIGRPTGHPNVVMVEDDRPAAYCVVGRPNAIVVTSAALRSLSRSELKAVLAHENAHISGRHHYILIVLRAVALTLPRLPLFARAERCVAELLEMCADDTAARRVGTRPLLTGLIALAGHQPVAYDGLAAAATAVVTRAQRLVTPTRSHVQWRHRICLAAMICAVVAAPTLFQVLCHH